MSRISVSRMFLAIIAAASLVNVAHASDEFVYEEKGTKVSLHNAACSNSKHVKQLVDMFYVKEDRVKQLTFKGPQASTKGCWVLRKDSEEIAVVTDVDPKVAMLPLQAFRSTSVQAPVQPVAKANVKPPQVGGGRVNPSKEEGYLLQNVSTPEGANVVIQGYQLYALTKIDPTQTCGHAYPVLARNLELRHRVSFAAAYSGVITRFIKGAEGQYQTIENHPVCYFVRGNTLHVFGSYSPFQVEASAFRSDFNL